ncbi:hypothetical protein [endosymbiont GvMRE of Glomus versiforme]|uniref:hypothetical protein n=1 Tax=endosymbiont GvMRE of Glomus versiforme TaxID=2039283 RepID=UPI000EEAEB0C|nr:hypothetical protein [endosymbiont GvMRE of Glomus versiforme]RHZ36836.1 hypothetical protein GvMRE_I2g291 [endosymbiont GvMRE of Glomus versiforme]
MNDKKTIKVEEVPSNEEIEKTRAEKTLHLLEDELKSLIQQKKELKTKFQNKFHEVEKELQILKTKFQKKFQEIEKEQKNNQEWFDKEWQKATKLENKMILLWDYYQREVEILALQKQIQSQVLSTNRQESIKRLDKLIALNAGLEKGFKERQIEPELMEKLRKKIGAWE